MAEVQVDWKNSALIFWSFVWRHSVISALVILVFGGGLYFSSESTALISGPLAFLFILGLIWAWGYCIKVILNKKYKTFSVNLMSTKEKNKGQLIKSRSLIHLSFWWAFFWRWMLFNIGVAAAVGTVLSPFFGEDSLVLSLVILVLDIFVAIFAMKLCLEKDDFAGGFKVVLLDK